MRHPEINFLAQESHVEQDSPTYLAHFDTDSFCIQIVDQMYARPQRAAADVQKVGGGKQSHGLQEQKLESAPLVPVLHAPPKMLFERFRGDFL